MVLLPPSVMTSVTDIQHQAWLIRKPLALNRSRIESQRVHPNSKTLKLGGQTCEPSVWLLLSAKISKGLP